MANNLISNDFIVINSNDLVTIIKKTIEVVHKEGGYFSQQMFLPESALKKTGDENNAVKGEVEQSKTCGNVSNAKSELGLMNVSDLAEYTNYAKATIYQFVHKNMVPHHKKGKRLYFKRDEIDQWLQGGD